MKDKVVKLTAKAFFDNFYHTWFINIGQLFLQNRSEPKSTAHLYIHNDVEYYLYTIDNLDVGSLFYSYLKKMVEPLKEKYNTFFITG